MQTRGDPRPEIGLSLTRGGRGCRGEGGSVAARGCVDCAAISSSTHPGAASMLSIHRPALLVLLALGTLHATGAAAQQRAPERCTVVPDTAAAPSPQQVREADEMREQLRAILRAHGQAEQGLLMVDVDSTRRGRLLFMEADIPDSTRAVVLAHVADYLQALPGGGSYQALVRMDATYPAVVPGVRQCRPDVVSWAEFTEARSEVQLAHPAAGRHRNAPLQQQALVLLVVTRDGNVAYAEVVGPSGDEYLDANAVEVAKLLRFDPASLDEVPVDVRIRFPVAFRIH